HVDLERNGRADLFEHVDLSRTVGWFTAVQPVTIDRFREQPVAALLKAVGAAVREAPYDGLGMGVLRYLSPDPAVRASLAALPHAEVLVNYLGRMDGAPADGGLFAVTDEPTGRTVSPAVARSHVIELNAGLWGGCLRAELSFPDSAEHRATIDRWLDGIVTVLDEFAALALAADAEAPQAAQLAGEHLPAALPLTPLQQGILFHSLRDPSPYFDQLCITLDGALDVAAFRAAWHRALARHEILRTSFHWHDTSTPLQRVHADAVLPWQLEDWRGIAPDAHPAALHALMQRDRDAGFDLAQASLMRMHLIRTGDARHTLVWSAHHLLLDGWSVSILMGEIFALYREARGDLSSRLPDAPPFTAYVRWHEAQRREHGDAGVAFWRRTLQGIDAPTSLAFLR
ncbi:non-ribosomal peptide synthetase, partial [Paraburkholderia sp. Se-20369]|nr:non-ribosomal peptide synthetase [Paraburkholderia sp. Se-20369]